MGSSERQAFIEAPHFPISAVNEASAKEKGPGRPPHWEMVFWWTRKPLAGARAVIAGTLLPATIDSYRFKSMLRLSSSKAPHTENPSIPESLMGYFNSKSPFRSLCGLRINTSRSH